jgi:hypothetical protein
MKILSATLIAICLFTLTCSAQWSTTSPNIYNLNTGNVGIGVTAPASRLSVLDSANALQLRLGGVVTGLNPGMRFSGKNVAGTANRNADIQLDADGGVFNFFAPANSTPSVKALNILMGGKVGVGTTAPGTAFDVLTTTTANGIRALNSGTLGTASGGGLLAANSSAVPSASGQQLGQVGFGGISTGTTYKYSSLVAGYASESWGGATYGSYLTFSTVTNGGTAPAERMRIDNAGNVGIGTTNTTGKLAIDANTAAPSIVLHVTNTAGGANNNGAVTFGGSGSSAGSYGFIDYNPNSAAGVRYSALGPLVFGSNTNVGYSTSTFTEAMRVTASGNVGIGTQNPDTKLAVNGTVHADQVIVDANVPTPDYVFDKSYDLPTLDAVKTFIDKNHHLPEIPSAAEVAKNGQNLGGMNMLLLKKVEELTLYLIAKDKKEKEQEARINKLEKQLQGLAEKLK